MYVWLKVHTNHYTMYRYRKIAGDKCEGGVSGQLLPPSNCGKDMCTCTYTHIIDLFEYSVWYTYMWIGSLWSARHGRSCDQVWHVPCDGFCFSFVLLLCWHLLAIIIACVHAYKLALYVLPLYFS